MGEENSIQELTDEMEEALRWISIMVAL
jgi:hypothetical protein